MCCGMLNLKLMMGSAGKAGVGGGSWTRETEARLSQATSLGVWSSGNDSTRRYRGGFYLGQLAKAQLEVCYYERMLGLEEQKAQLVVHPGGPGDGDCEALAAQIRVLKLQEQVNRLRGAVGGKGKAMEKDGEEELENKAGGAEVESGSCSGQQATVSELGCGRERAGVC